MNLQNLLDSLLARGLAEQAFPGAVAACGDGAHVFALSLAGKIAQNGQAVTRETRYDMASLSKVLGPTMIALKALEAGEITLYDRLARFFPDAPADKRDITVLQLMTHTAGFPPSFRLDHAVERPEDALDAILRHPLDTPPGAGPHYSCMGYIVLGKALETLYGQGLDALAAQRVFAPLGMAHTGYCPAGENFAATEVDPQTGLAYTGVVHDENARFLRGVSGNAGVFSCVEDMTRFAQMLARGGDGYLSPATLRRAIQCHTPGADARRGLGFHLAGTPENFMGDLFPACSFGHTGFTGTSLAVDPTTGFFVVLLTNRVHPTRDNARLFPFRRALHNALYAQAVRENGPFPLSL